MDVFSDTMPLLEQVETCRICGGSRFGLELACGEWRLIRCEACDIVFTSPRYTAQTLVHLYSSAYYEKATDYFASQSAVVSADHERVARQAARHIRGPRGGSVDIGSGCGRLVAAFAKLGFRAKGTEPSGAACSVARQLGRDVVSVDIADLPADTFQCVTAMHVLEHVPEPMEFVQHMWRVTTPGGVVVIEVPNYASKKSRRMGAKWPSLYPSTHLFQFTPTTLADVCRRAGLVILAVHRVGGAGMCEGLTPGAGASASETSQKTGKNRLYFSKIVRRLKRVVWSMRQPFLTIPGLRPLLRWVNWEVLGHGEFVRIIARKPE